jgi:hypothetical protein
MVDIKKPVMVLNHTVDGNAIPHPPRLELEEHQRQGEINITRDGNDLYVNGEKIEFYLSENQQNGKGIKGNELRRELASKKVLNANVLEYLLAHQELIPDSWKYDAAGKYRHIFFWGTIYRSFSGNLLVRYLGWGDEWRRIWYSSYHEFGLGWFSDCPAATLAS